MYISLKRNLAKEVRDYVDDELDKSGDTFVAGIIASNVVDRLRREDPELLTKFLDQHAHQIITRMIGDIARAQRSHARANAGRKVYSEALERHEAGETRALASWLDTVYVVTADDQRKRLGDMTQDELLYAANDYSERARTNAAQAAFLRALAERVGANLVSDIFNDEDLARMWNSLL